MESHSLARIVRGSSGVKLALVLASAALTLTAACDRPREPEPAAKPAQPAAKSELAKSEPSTKDAAAAAASGTSTAGKADGATFAGARPAAERIVAIGDLHGDLEATRRVLRLAGAIDEKDAWKGGKLVVVQTGDEIDRGDDDRKILDLVEKLKGEAEKAGGAFIALVGNHEIMNATLDFRYVTPGGYSAFADVVPKSPEMLAALSQLDPKTRGRAMAFTPGGPYATMLARRPVIAQVGDTVFAHGGVLPKHVTFGIDRINASSRAWLLGEESNPPSALVAEDGPLWTRMYSAAPGREECQTLDKALTAMKAKRMVMGHTVQRSGASSACDGKAWRIDVGMSKFFGGNPEAIEIRGDAVTVLK